MCSPSFAGLELTLAARRRSMPSGIMNIKGKERARRSPRMRFHDMTWPLLRTVPRDRTVILAPIAACEQHSRHLPTYTDTLLVTAVAEAAEQRLPQQILLLPTQWFGASSHHLRFGATLSAEVDTHITMICDMLVPLLEDGYQRILVLNGHGGNIDTMHLALRRLQPRYRSRLVAAASYWELAEQELAGLAQGQRKTMGHACEFETSMVLALRPDLVHREKILNDPPTDEGSFRGVYTAEDMKQRTDHGAVGYPELATAEKGRRFLDVAVGRTVEVVRAMLGRKLPE